MSPSLYYVKCRDFVENGYVYVTHINMQKICEVKYESHLED